MSNIYGYIFTLIQLQGLGDKHVKDININTDSVSALEELIKNITNLNIEDFKDTGYRRIGNEGIYLSKSLRQYLFGENTDPNEEGVVCLIHYNINNPDSTSENESKGSEDPTNPTLSFFYKKPGLSSEEEKSVIKNHILNEYKRRNAQTASSQNS